VDRVGSRKDVAPQCIRVIAAEGLHQRRAIDPENVIAELYGESVTSARNAQLFDDPSTCRCHFATVHYAL
jgi:hypothetical protein